MSENSTYDALEILRPSPERLREEVDELVFAEAPRRLAICVVNEAEADAVILAWGLRYGDGGVDLCSDHRRLRGEFGSLESAMRVAGSGVDFPLRLVWVDAPRTGFRYLEEQEEVEAV